MAGTRRLTVETPGRPSFYLTTNQSEEGHTPAALSPNVASIKASSLGTSGLLSRHHPVQLVWPWNKQTFLCSRIQHFNLCGLIVHWGFPGGSDSKESACNAGYLGLIPGLGRAPGEGNGYPFQHSCLENSMSRGACWVTIHEVTNSQTRLSD